MGSDVRVDGLGESYKTWDKTSEALAWGILDVGLDVRSTGLDVLDVRLDARGTGLGAFYVGLDVRGTGLWHIKHGMRRQRH